jgi:D-psicose/D-tagatose/L-ribulose 3-epimerase
MIKTALCNELFGKMNFSESCDLAAAHGYDGIEIAPFTLFGDVTSIEHETVLMIRDSLKNSGLEFAGLHWLFVKPDNLHITSRDRKIRDWSWEHLNSLIGLAGDLGGGNLILGSPKQRIAADISVSEAWDYMTEGLIRAAETADACNSTVCLEALDSENTNVVNTLEESMKMIKCVNRNSISGMFDFHNCGDEKSDWDELIKNNISIIKHVHLNTPQEGHPGPEDVEKYSKSFQTLKDKEYSGWVSLEIFTLPEDPKSVLKETADFIKKIAFS